MFLDGRKAASPKSRLTAGAGLADWQRQRQTKGNWERAALQIGASAVFITFSPLLVHSLDSVNNTKVTQLGRPAPYALY